MKKFTNETMQEIFEYLQNSLINQNPDFIISFEVLNPDIITSAYAGEKTIIDDQEYLYRGYKSWTDLAELLFCKMLTPTINSKNSVIIRFQKLDISDSFHKSTLAQKEKYGINSEFFSINKNEEPAFLAHYLKALKNVDISSKKRILNLGINSGDEFEVIKNLTVTNDKEFVGIDFCPSAIETARDRFKEENFTFYNHDINELDSLNLGKFDLIITIGTLQSSGLNFKVIFMSLIQNYLETDGAIILGFPNCRWMGKEMIYGAKAPNYSFSEMTLLYKDVYFCKKYLQQKKFRVTLTGKNYVFLTATSIRK
ncbi:class I SAM-dependent methyltransferase [Arcobacter sp. FWKO B]|uniref:class I SAM-dependent methyltransferase n=1 Tax=Arcobacter sp. FWKO B TaxID=2593672 RepID=UPI0018A4FAA9|nr:methyltransferase domain-containing protein [Arcobacter sp. FWKO B]QOG12256.1 methyltransferase domain-containing protein [Arcobacter sp. FWKO B]